MSRPEFARAWEELLEPIRAAVKNADAEAVTVALIRYAIVLHMQNTQTEATTEGKELFEFIVNVCWDTTLKDYQAERERSEQN
jgi:ketosteroid isomerase-like protein